MKVFYKNTIKEKTRSYPGMALFFVRPKEKVNKNSSGDEIANANFLRRYRTHIYLKIPKKSILRLTNYTIAIGKYCALKITIYYPANFIEATDYGSTDNNSDTIQQFKLQFKLHFFK